LFDDTLDVVEVDRAARAAPMIGRGEPGPRESAALSPGEARADLEEAHVGPSWRRLWLTASILRTTGSASSS
jgi:hypothetical protein